MNHLQHLLDNKQGFFSFMQQQYPIMFHSNVFFRDIQYAILSYFELKESPLTYSKAEDVAIDFINKLVESEEFSPIDNKTWKVNFEIGSKNEPEKVEEVNNE